MIDGARQRAATVACGGDRRLGVRVRLFLCRTCTGSGLRSSSMRERHAWLLPFVAVLFPGGLALFFAAGCGLARLRWSNGPARVALLAREPRRSSGCAGMF